METDASVTLTPADQPSVWSGCVEWEPDGDMWRPWRLPVDRLATAHAPELAFRARMAAGVHATLRTDATSLSLDVDVPVQDPDVAPLDVIVNGNLLTRKPLAAGVTTCEVSLPSGMKRVEVWLPQIGVVSVGALTLTGGSTAEAAQNGALRWITYGSSITQCAGVDGPSETWPALVARQHGWDLQCLGFSGQCHLDPVVAKTIAELPADLISLCLGINIYGGATFSERTLGGQVSSFIESVRDAHPEIPIVVISPIGCPDREDTPNAVGLTLSAIRKTVTDVTHTLQDRGDARLHVINGLEVLALDEAHLLPDGLHPGPEGYRLMASRLAPELAQISTAG